MCPKILLHSVWTFLIEKQPACPSQSQGLLSFGPFQTLASSGNLSFPVTLRGRVWEQEGAGIRYWKSHRGLGLRAHVLPPLGGANSSPAPLPLRLGTTTLSLGRRRSWRQVGEPPATWPSRSAGVHGKGLVGHRRGHPAYISLFLRQELVAPI